MVFSRRASLTLIAAASAFCAVAMSTAAKAESTFLLQFGSYNTESQAEQKWSDIKSKNADVVGKLTLHVAEVALPPDNTTMYRTQAGPVSSHDTAASLCGTLQSRGVECYVVETAMFTSDPLPAQALNDTPPTVVAPAATLPATAAAAAAAITPAPAAIASAPTLSTAAMAPAVDTPIAVAAATPAPAATKPGFFSRLFGGSDEEPPTTPPAPPAPVAAPVTPVAVSTPATAIVAPAAPVLAVPAIAAPAVVAMAAEPVAAAPATPDESNSISYVPAPPPPPQPPAPAPMGQEVAPGVTLLNAPEQPAANDKPGFFGRIFGSNSASASTSAPAAPVVAATPAPVAPLSITPAPVAPTPQHVLTAPTPLFAAPAPAPVTVPASPNVVGDVKVAEAIRVPLGSGGPGDKAPKKLPPVHGLGGFPSAPTHRTVWAQISYFSDENEARNFYESFHAAYPQFSDGVRVRITRPFMGSAGRVSLRVGPFAGTSDVNTICAAAAQRGARCTLVREISNSVAATTTNRREGYSSAFDDRTLSTASPSAAEDHASTYWVQIGTFHSPDTAWDKWNDLKEDNKKLLGRVHATVSTPPMSSANRAIFRLRAGPYVSEVNANALCNKLQQETGTTCIVLNDR